MKTVVYGSWHLAEVYAIGLCKLGHEVTLVARPEVVEEYKKGKPPVFEPGVAEGIKEYAASGKLKFSTYIAEPSLKSDICFFAQDCTITPEGIDMVDIKNQFDAVARSGNFKIISISAQLPIGTCRLWQNEYPEIQVVYYPEFLRLGDAIKRFIETDTLVLGGDPEAVEKVFDFFVSTQVPKFSVTLEEAEMSKHAANIFVAMSVSFLSELTKFSDHFNINLERIGEILRADKRVGPKAYVMPGMGFSGETVERDIRVLIHEAQKFGVKLPMFEQVIAVNAEHNKFIERELRKRISDMKGKKVAFIGATYKPFTSTLRGSLVAPLMDTLAKEGVSVALYDPLVEKNAYTVTSLSRAFEGADAVVITVGKKEFKEADYGVLIPSMRQKIVIDAANMFKKEDVKKLGVDYSSIGRGKL
jgi:UDPglucose 6-dehydrogenase